MLKGIGVSPGIAIARVFILEKYETEFKQISILSSDEELSRLENAISTFIDITQTLVKDLIISAGEEESAILEGHILIAQDPEIKNTIQASINDDNATCEHAIETSFSMFEELFASMDDELMQQRASDLKDIKTRLIEILSGNVSSPIKNINYDCILVAHDLTPSDTGQMNKKFVKGIVAEVGGMTSHTAIISRAMELPAVLGTDGIVSKLNNNDIIIVNGNTGEIIINPSEQELAQAKALHETMLMERKRLESFKDLPATTKDNHNVMLFANIGGLDDLDSIIDNGAQGIGLFRTEFLFMDKSSAPSEEEQFSIYKQVAQRLNGKPVIIRTLDIGGDKDVPYLKFEKEDNPFLGYRAIRLCLDRKDIFTKQLRALLRASAFGDIQIMIPMISCLEELLETKQMIEQIKQELITIDIPFNNEIKIGIMIETPAAAIISDILAKECDFFSIGTNDLTQYTMAVDRGNKKVSYLYSTFNPAVLRSIVQIIKNAKKAGILVGMCGESAGDPAMIPFLLGAGLDEFSMSASSILKSKKLISNLSYKELQGKTSEILSLSTAKQAQEYLESLI